MKCKIKEFLKILDASSAKRSYDGKANFRIEILSTYGMYISTKCGHIYYDFSICIITSEWCHTTY